MQLILTNSDCDVLDKAASWAVDAGFGGFKNEAQAKTVMLLALSQGEHIGRAIHEYHVINGKLVLKSESMLARFQTAGGSIKYLQYADDAVTVEATHPKGGTLAVTWDLAQANVQVCSATKSGQSTRAPCSRLAPSPKPSAPFTPPVSQAP